MQSSLTRLALSFSTLLLSTSTILPAYADTGTKPATQAATPVPIEDFFSNAALSGAVLSPDGRHLAVLVSAKGGRIQLYTVDLPSMKVKGLTSFEDADIDRIDWVNNQRIVYSVADRNIAQGDVRYGPGLYAINIDGSGYRQLASNTYARNSTAGSRISQSMLSWSTQLFKTSSDAASDDVFVTETRFSTTGKPSSVILRLNTVTGLSKLAASLNEAQGWLMDKQDEVRIAITSTDTKETIHYRDNAATPWRKLHESDIYHQVKGDFTPAFFDAKGNFYVRAGHHGMEALYLYDLKTATMKDTPLADTPGYDFEGQPVHSEKKLLGLRFETDAGGTIWFDKDLTAVQAKVDTLLPNTINRLSVPQRSETPFVLVVAASDVEPGTALIYNTETGALMPLGGSHPAIDSSRMSPKTMVRYKARDGLEIPAYLTLPKGKGGKNLPMVVMVHGGPWVRGGHWNWNRETQFLASRGYAVLEPDYRGSTGYGAAFYKAGWKQWGLKMQDDIADGARWAIAQGYADPQRICIAGASYGGYSTLMGLLNDADLFKCGINWVGVTDINMMRDGHWTGDSDLADSYKKYGMKDMVGDPVLDAAQLKATSPIVQAARIKQPLLLGYGGADQRVPISHGRAFYDAVKKNNSQVEWVVYQEEGHGWALPKNNVDFWTRAEKLLARSIGPGNAPVTPGAN
ncbi:MULTISPECIES: prolyl oligopeptidase family serine peptidase [unclassified Janthinobacterium]|uniref:S9 family peptidase n=1 Tax=unclassified Janthinobacterium TaxID=2610881 RepID=UPI0016135F85|nr:MULTISPECIES: prolyl oligopeptidase family serine peptidase [unclassified Janthinobacterium]MBB5610204.1 dipeptidyl aminopeptidase/acylaminoacyl peptidase [Janthinobacterium sp. S3T4]MBB5615572.1 dipeptidyl aminopeptidase/acylaminoacyl peptidase [Janthinobacterium sp. S3M3]